ncbi:Inosine-5'-monophosphate dehydrogenase [Clavibacter michiganensis subsp. michiganensis]|nr:Inosine-5'-monophosphate dehydrogenase [Clavibacter michiganensis subsp. michiganensis]
MVESDGTLVGIITNRDMRFVSPVQAATTLVRDVMTRTPLITGQVGIDPDHAIAIFAEHKIEKLPLVDDQGKLRGLITVKDFDKSEQYRTRRRTPRGASVSGRPSASSATPGSARSRSSRPAWTCSSSTPPTATARACSTSSAA